MECFEVRGLKNKAYAFRVVLIFASVNLGFLPASAAPNEHLNAAANCIGGVWIGQTTLKDAKGQQFIVLRECKWSAHGAALMMRQDFVYEDGIRQPTSEGMTAWDPVAQTLRTFGAFAHGGVIYESTVDPETLGSDKEIQRFKFASAQSGEVSNWQNVENRIDENSFKEDGMMLVDGEWKTMSSVTFQRIEEFRGAETFNQIVSLGQEAKD